MTVAHHTGEEPSVKDWSPDEVIAPETRRERLVARVNVPAYPETEARPRGARGVVVVHGDH